MQYRDAGYLPHALLNYLARLGWSHGDQEIFSIAEMIALFDLKDVNAKASRLDSAKLGWLNQQYLKNDDPAEVGQHLEWHLRAQGYDLAHGPGAGGRGRRAARPRADAEGHGRTRRGLVPAAHARTTTRRWPSTSPPPRARRWPMRASAWRRSTRGRPNGVAPALHATAEALGLGMGKVAQPLRVAITGTQVSPDISHTVYLAGQGEALAPHRRRACKTARRGLDQASMEPRMTARLHRSAPPRPRRRCLRARGRARLRGSAGCGLTPIRANALRLIADAGRPVKAYELLDQMKATHGAAAPPTVYRALDFLLEHGFIHKLASINAFVGCHHPGGAAHAVPFLICDRCHSATELEDDASCQPLDARARALGFVPQAQTLEVHGLCANLRARSRA